MLGPSSLDGCGRHREAQQHLLVFCSLSLANNCFQFLCCLENSCDPVTYIFLYPHCPTSLETELGPSVSLPGCPSQPLLSALTLVDLACRMQARSCRDEMSGCSLSGIPKPCRRWEDHPISPDSSWTTSVQYSKHLGSNCFLPGLNKCPHAPKSLEPVKSTDKWMWV